MLSNVLDNRFTDSVEVVSPQHSALSPQLCLQTSDLSPQPSAPSPQSSALSPQSSALRPQPSALVFSSVRGRADPRDILRLEESGNLKYSMTTTGMESQDFPACNAVPQPPTLLRDPYFILRPQQTNNKLRVLSPRANYTDRATAALRRN
jgi:hypothetical protein